MCTVQYMNYKSIYVTTGVSSRPTPALTTQHSPLTLEHKNMLDFSLSMFVLHLGVFINVPAENLIFS